MSLLHEIQESLVQEGTSIGPNLLKLRLLASQLGSNLLEEWVRHESEGYPTDVHVPDYRKMDVSYTADFNGPLQSHINNAPIPAFLIEKHAGKEWNVYEERRSVNAVDSLIQSTKSKSGSLHIPAPDLILLLQGQVYEGYACNSARGSIPIESLVELQSVVRNRILELTIKLEKNILGAATIAIGSQPDVAKLMDAGAVTQITNQVIHNYTEINSSGADTRIVLSIEKGDTDGFVKVLTANGIPESDAKELAAIVSEEKPQSQEGAVR